MKERQESLTWDEGGRKMVIKLLWERTCLRPVYLRSVRHGGGWGQGWSAGKGAALGPPGLLCFWTVPTKDKQNPYKLCLIEDNPDLR